MMLLPITVSGLQSSEVNLNSMVNQAKEAKFDDIQS
jgi:hypothetical protein